jgi:hypothetical protein
MADMDHHLADHLDRAAETLTTLDRRIPDLAVAAAAFGADDAGLPGRLGRRLHTHWAAALHARSEEARRLASRLTDTAQAVRTTMREYAETDELAQRRLQREM